MDISKLFDFEQTKEIDLINKETGALIGLKVNVRSAYSEVVEQVERDILEENARFVRENPEAIIPMERVKQQIIRRSVALVSSWEWGEHTFKDLGTPNSSDEHKKIVLSDPAFRAVFFPQIEKASKSFGNFSGA